jgi:hypothetical protein
LNEFVSPISVNEHLRSEKDMKARFADVFSAEFSLSIDKIHLEMRMTMKNQPI